MVVLKSTRQYMTCLWGKYSSTAKAGNTIWKVWHVVNSENQVFGSKRSEKKDWGRKKSYKKTKVWDLHCSASIRICRMVSGIARWNEE